MSPPVVRVTYLVRSPAQEIAARAERLMLEQSVELPRRAVRDERVVERVFGQVEAIEIESEDRYRVRIAQPLSATALDPAQFLNLLYGNSSLQPDVLLLDVELPASGVDFLPGPRAGVPGIRALTGVTQRPLLATALKPMGLDPKQLADLCAGFARAGLDIVKDDHGLADHPFCPFEARVEACLRAVTEAAGDTGRETLYVPNLIGSPDTVVRQLAFARDAGARAVLLSPILLGLPLLRQLAVMPQGLPIIAHPAFGGGLRISEALLFGRLFRWYGADASIFPHVGGRFSYGPDTCRAVAVALREPHERIRAAFPVPAGGVRVEGIAEVVRFYGKDCILLIGGSLYEAGDALFERARDLVGEVARAARELAA